MNADGTLRWALVLLVLGACGPQEPQDSAPVSEREQSCETMCVLVACEGLVGSDQGGGCTERCIEQWADLDDEGDECERSYEQSVECFSALECSQFQAWQSGDESVCREPLESFEAQCPDMTFDFRP